VGGHGFTVVAFVVMSLRRRTDTEGVPKSALRLGSWRLTRIISGADNRDSTTKTVALA